jgi:predicted nucleic acid-binding protein
MSNNDNHFLAYRMGSTAVPRLIDGLQLPDPDDLHVLAAAIRGRADVIVTANPRNFHLFDLAPATVISAARRHRQSLASPTKTVDEYLEMLYRAGLPETVSMFRDPVAALGK